MKKFFKEFKAFITRGNVIDLAVGMIIGAAFTAIVTALVNGIFKPLINAIPMGDGLSGLITMLVPAYTIDAATGAQVIDMTKSVYINWGDFIMAIVNFLLTAFILFLIIKAINTLREGAGAYKKLTLSKDEKNALKAQGMTRMQMLEYQEKKAAEEAEAAAKAAEANKPETTEQILNDIRELLKSLQPAQAQAVEKELGKAQE